MVAVHDNRRALFPALPKGSASAGTPSRRHQAPDAGVRGTGSTTGLQFILVIGIIGLSALATAGADPQDIGIGLALAGIAACIIALRGRLNRQAEAETVARREAALRAETERLADRMWELHESEERFRGLVDALGDIVVHRDRDGRIVQANAVLAEVLRRSADDLVGRTLPELGIDIGLVPDAAFARGECLSSTDVAVNAPSGRRWYSWIELSVRDEKSDAISHSAIARDITDRKRAEIALIGARERAEHASKAKSRFLATVSHEIRTPMNGIMGMAKLLAGTPLEPEQRTYLGAITTSSSALLALIDDLLDFSKIEAGRLDLEPQKISPRELAEHTVELMAARAFAKDIGIGCHVAPDVPATVMLDPGRFRQILLNLLGNAIKFTDLGGVTVSLTRRLSGDRRLVLEVTDTGVGMAPEDVKRIFEEFEQGDSSRARKHDGAGLGLAITRRIVEAMDGSITVETAPGQGSCFRIELPVVEPVESAVDPRGALSERKVLVLTPRKAEGDALAMTIAAQGGQPVCASAYDEAAALIRAGREFDTVLIDASLETVAGDLLKGLRGAGLARARAVTMIAPSNRGQLAEFRASGYAAFLPRPVRGDTLLRVLIEDEKPRPADRKADGAHMPVRHGEPLRILVAEDNEINAILARAALTKAGHEVQVVTNGKSAIDALAGATHFDVVLMDLHMPVLDGLDAIGRIRKLEQERGAAPVPILVLSADSQEQTRQHVLTHGASGFLSKPLDPAELVEAVERQAV